ncbi:MAG: prepilin-type N-terminal cleavage/methylation domain-containing protein [Gemmatimonadales bacterium]
MQHRKGFALIEALVVVVVIGILAAVVTPAFRGTNKAVLASMRSDLRNLVTAQEEFFRHRQRYAGAIGATQTATRVTFVPSSDNAITLSSVTSTGWAAEATNPTLEGTITRCGIFVGSSPPPNGAVRAEGAPACY